MSACHTARILRVSDHVTTECGAHALLTDYLAGSFVVQTAGYPVYCAGPSRVRGRRVSYPGPRDVGGGAVGQKYRLRQNLPY